ncbi:MAG: hypothetical protein EOO40_11395 [Deltaproteobacteria bacterium]|nr:MAG: hypothetical protein EOO40_11395 [Deltaproteobacteria bacterium]
MASKRRACMVPEAKRRTMLASGLSYEGIGRAMGHESDTRRIRCIALRVAKLRTHPPEPPREAAMRHLLSIDGVHVTELARACGLNPSQFRMATQRYGLPTDSAGRAALQDARS